MTLVWSTGAEEVSPKLNLNTFLNTETWHWMLGLRWTLAVRWPVFGAS